jgi:hypothetical protein
LNKSNLPTTVTTDPTVVSLNDRLGYFEKILDEKFSARDLALSVALTAMDRRLDGMNEFRDALRDQASRFLPREEYLAAHSAIAHDMDGARIALSKYAVRVDEYDKTSSVERAQLDKRLDAMNEFRAQLKDQAATLMTRSETEALIAGLLSDVRRLEIAAGQKAGRDDTYAAFDRIDTRMKLVEAKLATWDGRLWALGTVFLMINIFVSWWLSGIHMSHP